MNNDISGMLPDERDRLTKVEVILVRVEDFMNRSEEDRKKDLEEVKKSVKEHDDFIKSLKERIVWIGSAFTILINLVIYAGTWAMSHINLGWDK